MVATASTTPSIQAVDASPSNDGSDATYEECSDVSDCDPGQSLADGSIRLTGGRDELEGNVEVFFNPIFTISFVLYSNHPKVYHAGVWGGVCDDEWDLSEAGIVCRVLGYPGAETATHGGKFGYSPATIWMDNMYCYGTEKRLEKCRQGLYNTG